MSLNKRIKSLIFLNLVLFSLVFSATAQNTTKNCFEVKYLDFFGLDKSTETNLSDTEIDALFKTNFSENFEGTRFLIPVTISYLKNFHPDCNREIDTQRFDRLVSLYFKIRLKDISPVENKTIKEKLDFIRNDFYNSVQDEKLLPLMRYTMDDGPLYGEIPKDILKSKSLEKIDTDFGKVEITKSNDRIIIIATNKQNKAIWRRILKGKNPDRYLKNLRFNKDPLEETSLATIIHFYSEGERLDLFLKHDGRFMYYYHSW